MKKFIFILAVALTVFIFASCATQNSSLTWYSDGTVTMAQRAEATNTVWLGMFGTGTYPLAEQIAKDNGIKRIASVERYFRVGVFGLWIDYTTVITGE